MQLATFSKYGIVLFLAYLVSFGLWRMFPIKYEHYSDVSLKDIAKMDLNIVGDYGDKFKYSLRSVFEHIYQKLYVYKNLSFRKTAELLHKGAVTFAYDPELVVHSLIDTVCEDLEKRWEAYADLRKDSEEEPFNVQIDNATLPEPSSVLRCNDHLCVEHLYALYYDTLNKKA